MSKIVDAAKAIGLGVACFGLCALSVIADTNCTVEKSTGYSDAVKTILNDSGMFSSDINKALEALKKDKDTEYYKAVIAIAKSDMFSSEKLKTITALN